MGNGSMTTVAKRRWAWLVGSFCTVSIVTWLILGQLVSPRYVSSGVIELGYFNPRDYQPHPVMSTRAVVALVNDPAFTGRVVELTVGHGHSEKEQICVTAAPLEDGVIRIEVRASTSHLAQTAATHACSVVVGITGKDYRREKALLDGHVRLIKERAALAESLIFDTSKVKDQGTVQSGALRALAMLTEVEVKKETEAELVGQKKRSVIVVSPGPGSTESPATLVTALGPGIVVTVLLAAAFIAREQGRSEQQV